MDANTTGQDNTAVGYNAMGANTTASDNTALGTSALGLNTTGTYNTGIGRLALYNNTTSSNSTAVGYKALYGTGTTGYDNTAIGREALRDNSSGYRNVAIGMYAMKVATGADVNVCIGYNSGVALTEGTESVIIGYSAGSAQTTAGHNTYIGYSAGGSATVGGNNVMIGSMAGDHDTSTVTGYQNTFVGSRCNSNASNTSDEGVFGYNITGKGTNTFMVGGTSGAYNAANNSTWSTTSDIRIKKNINDNATGLDKINQIQVKNFEYKTEDEIKTDSPELTDVVKSAVVHKEGVQVGSIAQEIEKILPEVVRTDEHGVKSVNESPLTWYMINAIKELSAKNDALAAEVEQLKSQLNN